MVVAQIPLWMIHGTSSSSSGVASTPIDASKDTSKDTASSGLSNNTNRQARNQLNMWNNSTKIGSAGSGSNNGSGAGNQTNTDPAAIFAASKSTERRSAIYCCDISSSSTNGNDSTNVGGGIGGRIATGGGDGKIRIWNLHSLFNTNKAHPATPDQQQHQQQQQAKRGKTTGGTMAAFRNGGEYESSDDSCSASESASSTRSQTCPSIASHASNMSNMSHASQKSDNSNDMNSIRSVNTRSSKSVHSHKSHTSKQQQHDDDDDNENDNGDDDDGDDQSIPSMKSATSNNSNQSMKSKSNRSVESVKSIQSSKSNKSNSSRKSQKSHQSNKSSKSSSQRDEAGTTTGEEEQMMNGSQGHDKDENDDDNDNDNDNDDENSKNDNDNEVEQQSQQQQSSSTTITATAVNDVSSLIKRKNDNKNQNNDKVPTTTITIDSKTGKKRKRAELIQIRPPPQAATVSTSAGVIATDTANANIAKPNTVEEQSKHRHGHTNSKNNNTNNTSFLSSNQQQQQQQQRLLCTLAAHSGSVLTLRFSSSGTYLASAGDDTHVLIYTRTNTPSILTTGNLLNSNNGNSNGSNNNNTNNKDSTKEEENVEHWDRIRILRGHNLDVVGLAWAPDDSHLVSCSLDSDTPICVWRLNLDPTWNDSGTTAGAGGNVNGSGNNNSYRMTIGQGNYNSASSTILHPFKVLGRDEHTSTVKGVAFDPAGKYVASSGDDPSICIWRAFDDWGLESKVDSSSGVFRSKKKQATNTTEEGDAASTTAAATGGGDGMEEDMQALASLSLFRRISFAPDGTHVCGTNATLRGKNIAAMISRNGWGVSVPKKGQSSSSNNNKGSTTAAGAANLVGHKQPVVSSRHCPFFFEQGIDDNEDDDIEPNYSTLVALGDKKGFVSIWSTKKSRPIFKLQCSESRCTVTDIAWGLVPSSSGHESIIMLVSLLDGFMVGLKFDLPNELGKILSKEKRHKIFRLKYGIELGSIGSSGRRLVDDKSAPKLIENVLQYAMEDDDDEDEDGSSGSELSEMEEDGIDHNLQPSNVDMRLPNQIESRSKNGKKRIKPVLLNESGRQSTSKSADMHMNGRKNKTGSSKEKSKGGNVPGALNLAEKAATIAEGISAKTRHGTSVDEQGNNPNTGGIKNISQRNSVHLSHNIGLQSMLNVVPPKMNQSVYTVELQRPKSAFSVLEDHRDRSTSTSDVTVIASCTNSTHSPPGMGRGVPCATLSLNRGGDRTWSDHILGTHCTSIAACSSLLVVGTFDGTVYLYGTSPTSGWDSGIAFRSHAPFVMSSSVTHLSLREKDVEQKSNVPKVEMLVLTSDGAFGIYSIMPFMKLIYKGNILPPMNQMRLSVSNHTTQRSDNTHISSPELARIFITKSEHLLLVLCHSKNSNVQVGGMIQGFVYNRNMEVWTRISDDRFLYSNFYTTVPTSKLSHGLLSSLDETVKGGKNRCQSQRKGMIETSASAMYYLHEDDAHSLQSLATRAHCEDRLACALVLQSSSDFKHWFSLYIRQLCIEADSGQLRFIIDMLLNENNLADSIETDKNCEMSCWWLIPGSSVLGLNKRSIVSQVVIPEMSKNRSLQRLMNEIATELNSI